MGRPSSYLGHAITPPSLESIQAPRPRLVNALNEKLDKKLILISAPAGFGKTTLLAEFSAQADRPVCWVRLTEADQDVMRLSEVLWTSLTRRFRRLRGAVRIEGLAGASSRALARAIAQALKDQVREPFVMVFDDVHWLNPSENGRAFLAELVKEGPDGQTIVTGGRELPDIPLVQLLASDQLATFDSDSLALRADELGEVVKRRTGEDVSEALVGDLMEETGGWVTGVLLSERLVSHHVPSLIAADEPLAYDYLAMAVFDRQPAAVQRFLLDSSVLPIMTAELCDSVLGRNDSQAMLNDLLRRGIFISVTDDDPKTYEYHQLFSSFLQSRAKTRDEQKHRRLLIRSARALSETDEWAEDAVELLMAAGEARGASRLAADLSAQITASGRLGTLRRWSDYFHQRRVPVPMLHSRLAFLLEAFGNRAAAFDALSRATQNAENLPEADRRGLQIRLLGFTAQRARDDENWSRMRSLLDELQTAISHDPLGRGQSELHQFRALYEADHLGDWHSAVRQAAAAINCLDAEDNSLVVGDTWITKSYIECYAGRLDWAEMSAEKAVLVHRLNDILYGKNSALMNLAYHKHLLGRFSEALPLLEEAKQSALALGSSDARNVVAITELEMISDLGLLNEAVARIAHLKGRTLEAEGFIFWKKYVCALEANLHRRAGDLTEASHAIAEGWKIKNAELHSRLVTEKLALLSRTAPEEVRSTLWGAWRRVPFRMQDRTLALFFLGRAWFSVGRHAKALWWTMAATATASKRGSLQMVAAELDADSEFHAFLSDQLRASSALDEIEGRIQKMHAAASRLVYRIAGRASIPKGFALTALGPATLRSGSSVVAPLTPQEMRLLVYLLEKGPVRGEALAEVFWPRSTPGNQASSLHTAVYRLRQVLGRENIDFSGGQYELTPTAISDYDVQQFYRSARQIDSLRSSQIAWQQIVRETLDQYSGPFLEGADDQWVLERRRELEAIYVELALRLGREANSREEAQASLHYLRLALRMDPYREDLNLAYMEVLSRLGRRVSKVQHERRYRRLLAKDLGIELKG
jgi:ATP/maltotriose-dependent transcriptional regulator MalT